MKSRAPVPPENVRIVHVDGTETPLETRYEGLDDDGIHRWCAVLPVPFAPGRDVLCAAKIPPRTSIAFTVWDDRFGGGLRRKAVIGRLNEGAPGEEGRR